MRKFSKQERLEHVENWKKGTISKAAYAKSAGIVPATFYTWTREKNNKKQEKGFVEIPLQTITGNKNEIIIEKKSVHIRVPLSIHKEELQTILQALEGIG